ncbi:hypothetical protein [Acidovorax sp. FHTAMBA]|jgi:hypothetical protein|uniref:hypothetical protein n=1 Tax=Acidovorax sp. FHTAMBA TaxID=3140252 RepID=UPI003183EDE5
MTARKFGHGIVALMPGLGGRRFDVRGQYSQCGVHERGHRAFRVGRIARMRRALGQGDPGAEQGQAKCMPKRKWEKNRCAHGDLQALRMLRCR